MKVVYSPQAAAQLAEIYTYIDARHPPGARKVKRAIRQAAGLLEQFPLLGVRADEPDVRMIGVGHYPYSIFYTVYDDEVVLVSIRHTARDK